METQPGSDGDRDLVTIFKTGSVDRDTYPELPEHPVQATVQIVSGAISLPIVSTSRGTWLKWLEIRLSQPLN